jgi:hypothetical protein
MGTFWPAKGEVIKTEVKAGEDGEVTLVKGAGTFGLQPIGMLVVTLMVALRAERFWMTGPSAVVVFTVEFIRKWYKPRGIAAGYQYSIALRETCVAAMSTTPFPAASAEPAMSSTLSLKVEADRAIGPCAS